MLHRPSSGSFVSYAREFFGEKAAFVAGWMYFFNWAMTAIVDITAIALYMHFLRVRAFDRLGPAVADRARSRWLWCWRMNMVSVKVFGEMEFWFALIKVVALVGFLVVGIVFVASGSRSTAHQVGFSRDRRQRRPVPQRAAAGWS